METNNTPSIKPQLRTNMIDMLTASCRDIKMYKKILMEAGNNSARWMRHHFIVVFDCADTSKEDELKKWVAETRELSPLPRVTVTTVLPENSGDPDKIRQQALALGENKYIYIQDDDDPLPLGLERRVQLMETTNVDVTYGICETVNTKGHLVESFPPLVNDTFLIDPIDGMSWFPTYPHPWSALFTRKLMEQIPIDDGEKHPCPCGCSFVVRMVNSDAIIQFLPDVVRKVIHHSDNDNGILSKDFRKRFASEIHTWKNYITNPEIAKFHSEVSQGLDDGSISTFKEIDALVEERLGY